MTYSFIYPLAAIIGQEELKLSLLLSAVNPAIGGILIRGEKGTAKSTAVRGLIDLLPSIDVVSGCRFSCDPGKPDLFCDDCRNARHPLQKKRQMQRLINLPLNCTEDRIAGGIDFSRTIRNGHAVFKPGLLADANRALLYIDEVNLLDDHIVDLILDCAASGCNIVEREGFSFSHPSRFILVGTMNPEEGELRPQLLDRFGLCIEVQATEDLEERVTLLNRREEFDHNPARLLDRFEKKSAQIRKQVKDGIDRLATVRMKPGTRSFIAELCETNHVAGHRADLVMEQAALALAALEGDKEVGVKHISRIAPMVLLHRSRDVEPPSPPQSQPEPDGESDEQNELQGEKPDPGEQGEPENKVSPATQDGEEQQEKKGRRQKEEEQQKKHTSGNGEDDEQLFEIGTPFKVKKISCPKDRQIRRGQGRRSRSRISLKQGRYSRAGKEGVKGDIALDATIRAAAPYQKKRTGSLAIKLEEGDILFKIREKRVGNLILFIVDGSGSMGARGRMSATKGAIMSLLLDAYQKRDKVAMVTFRRREAGVNLPVTNSVELAGKLLAEMAVGGRTPLSAGLVTGYREIRNYLVREPTGRPIVIILTDGKGNVSLTGESPINEMVRLANVMAQEKRAKYIVIDTEEEGLVTFGLAGKLAAALGGDFFKINDIQAEDLVNIVQEKQ